MTISDAYNFSLLSAQFQILSTAVESIVTDLEDPKQCGFTGKLGKAGLYNLCLRCPRKTGFSSSGAEHWKGVLSRLELIARGIEGGFCSLS